MRHLLHNRPTQPISRLVTSGALAALFVLSATTVRAHNDGLLGENSILFWSPEQQITGYRAIKELIPTRAITASRRPFPLLNDAHDFSGFTLRHAGSRLSLDAVLAEQHTAGIIVVQDGRIRLERYARGNDETSRWISFSVAKSVVSMLIGAAIKDGYITGTDDLVTDYLPRLKGSEYDGVTVEQVLQMASGVAWNEDYTDPQSDVARAPGGTLPMLGYLADLPRVAPRGEKFNYNTGETNIAGALLRAAIGNNLSTYLSAKIWQPFGMEHEAYWALEAENGVEYGGCCINATLRDYARIGLFAMRDGRLPNGDQMLPEDWMAASIAPSPGSDGYGYYWWLQQDGIYAALGVFGQTIWIDPANKIVIATHNSWPKATDRALHEQRLALFRALTVALTD